LKTLTSIILLFACFACGEHEFADPVNVVDQDGDVVDTVGYALESSEATQSDRAMSQGDSASGRQCSTLCECGRIWHPCNFIPSCEYYCGKVDGESLQSHDDVRRAQGSTCGTDSNIDIHDIDTAQSNDDNRSAAGKRKRGNIKQWFVKKANRVEPSRIVQIDSDTPFRLIRTSRTAQRVSGENETRTDADEITRSAYDDYTICPDLTTICGPHAHGEPDTSCCPEELAHDVERANDTREGDPRAASNR
jgi:hypothetical protein